MEAICFFKPWNGSVFPCGAVAEWLSSLPVFRRVICRFDASNPVGRFSTPVPERKQKMMRAAGVHLMGPASGAGRSRWAIVAPGRPSRQSRRIGRCGSTVRMRLGLPSLRAGHAQGWRDQSMTGICRRCHHMRGRGRMRRCINPGFRSLSGATAANRDARPAVRSMPHRRDSRRRRRG